MNTNYKNVKCINLVTYTHTHVETTSFVLGLLKKRNQGFMLGSTFVLKNSACCKMAVKASTPQTLQSLWRRNSTSSNQGPRECKTLVKKNNSQGAHMHTAILTPKTWPRHPRRKSTCLKRCSKEPEKNARPSTNSCIDPASGLTQPQDYKTARHQHTNTCQKSPWIGIKGWYKWFMQACIHTWHMKLRRWILRTLIPSHHAKQPCCGA